MVSTSAGNTRAAPWGAELFARLLVLTASSSAARHLARPRCLAEMSSPSSATSSIRRMNAYRAAKPSRRFLAAGLVGGGRLWIFCYEMSNQRAAEQASLLTFTDGGSVVECVVSAGL